MEFKFDAFDQTKDSLEKVLEFIKEHYESLKSSSINDEISALEKIINKQ